MLWRGSGWVGSRCWCRPPGTASRPWRESPWRTAETTSLKEKRGGKENSRQLLSDGLNLECRTHSSPPPQKRLYFSGLGHCFGLENGKMPKMSPILVCRRKTGQADQHLYVDLVLRPSYSSSSLLFCRIKPHLSALSRTGFWFGSMTRKVSLLPY